MSVSRMVYTGTSYFGENARAMITVEINKRKLRKGFLVTDENIVRAGIAGKIEETLKSGNLPYVLFSDVQANPDIRNVQSGVGAFAGSGCDFILAVGGGSVIDTAKAIAVIVNNPDRFDVESLEGMDKGPNMAVPIIAVPTTAGTGSETTMDYVITNKAQKRKMACMDSKAVPAAAILDTELMASQPRKLTASTAMDALTHAVESYLARGSFSFSEVLALGAVSILSKNLPAVLREPENLQARKELAVAEYMAGMSFTNTGLGICHSMAHPLSAFYGVPHGIANALILPFVIEYNAAGCREKIVRLAAAFNDKNGGNATWKEAAAFCAATVRALNREAGLPAKLREVGVRPEDFDSLAQSAYEDVSTQDNPVAVTKEELASLYRTMY